MLGIRSVRIVGMAESTASTKNIMFTYRHSRARRFLICLILASNNVALCSPANTRPQVMIGTAPRASRSPWGYFLTA
jgi:hypothetical protein